MGLVRPQISHPDLKNFKQGSPGQRFFAAHHMSSRDLQFPRVKRVSSGGSTSLHQDQIKAVVSQTACGGGNALTGEAPVSALFEDGLARDQAGMNFNATPLLQ